jgi:hypothetical protein
MSITLSDSTRSRYHTTDPFGTLRSCEKTNVIDIKSLYGVCTFRDTIETTGTASVHIEEGTYCLNIEQPGDSVIMTSAERGAYVSGNAVETSISLQVDPTELSGAQELCFGYYDTENGFYFKITAAGLALCVRKSGTTVEIPSSAWNGDFASSATVPISQGLSYLISFTYPFGSVLFSVVYSDRKGGQINRLLHSYAATGVSVGSPNLPIRTELKANASAAHICVHIGGRQFSVLGKCLPQYRLTSLIENFAGITSASWSYISTYLKKSDYRACRMKVHSCDVIVSSPVYLSFRCCTELVGATYTAQVDDPDCIPGASGLQRDTDATSAGSGIVLYTRLVPAGFSSFDMTTNDLKVNIDERPFSIFCKAVSAETSVCMVVRIAEDF